MCKFYSLIITEGNIYSDLNEHSHSKIIEKFNLEKFDRNQNLVKIEAVPKDYNTMEDFEITVDQDNIPSWFNLEVEADEILKHIKKHSLEELQLAAVNESGYAIQYIENPSEAMKLAAVNQEGCAIKCIKNPSEAVQLAAVNKNCYAIKYIENRTEAVKLAAVNQDGYAIKYIENPSKAMKLAAVNKNGCAIDYIENPSEAMKLAAVNQDGYAIKYIKNPSVFIKLYVVLRRMLKYIFEILSKIRS
jgi:hypothetical protein